MPAGPLAARFDLAVVGAGILGLATALAAVRRGLQVIVIDRDAQANGASVRNFGFVTVSGQQAGIVWSRARRSCELWQELAASADIPLTQRGMWMLMRRPESVALAEEFLRTDMAGGCRLLTVAEAQRRCPHLTAPDLRAVLESTVELRVEPRSSMARIAAWLASARGVTFLRSTTVTGIDMPVVQTSRGPIHAQRVAICPGDEFGTLYAEWLSAYGLSRCKLQMMRLADPGFRLPVTLMSDLGLARYRGFADLPAGAALAQRLTAEQPEHLRHGIHLVVAQDADGSLIVGDSHHYAPTPDPFSRADIDALILDEFHAALGIEPPPVLERWVGTYATATDRPAVLACPARDVGLLMVTSGAGMSLGPALAEEMVAGLWDGALSAV